MITRITLSPDPPPGKYSSGKRGTLSAPPEHPAAPSRDTPAAPAPAALKKSLRVSALLGFLLTPCWPSFHSAKCELYHVSTVASRWCRPAIPLRAGVPFRPRKRSPVRC